MVRKMGRYDATAKGLKKAHEQQDFTPQKEFVSLLKDIKAGRARNKYIIEELKILINQLPANRREAAKRYLDKAIQARKKIIGNLD